MIKFNIINSLQFILIPLVFFLVPLICHHMLKYICHTWKPQSIRCLRNPIWHIFICTKDRNTNLLSTDDYTHLWCIEVLGALDGFILSKEQTIDHFVTLAIYWWFPSMEFDVVQTMLTLVISLVVSFHAVLYYPTLCNRTMLSCHLIVA
jgi:hypothetical protein